MIEVKNLVKRYGDFEAVRGVSFEIKKGMIYGFLGPNGGGSHRKRLRHIRGPHRCEIRNRISARNAAALHGHDAGGISFLCWRG